MINETSSANHKESSKWWIVVILTIISIKSLFDVILGGYLSILQLVVDVFLIFILLIKPFDLCRKFVIGRAVLAPLLWGILSLPDLSFVLIVFLEECAISIPLLMLSIGQPRILRKVLAMGIFLIFGIGAYMMMTLLAL